LPGNWRRMSEMTEGWPAGNEVFRQNDRRLVSLAEPIAYIVEDAGATCPLIQLIV
jgi:hypothetical protein